MIKVSFRNRAENDKLIKGLVKEQRATVPREINK